MELSSRGEIDNRQTCEGDRFQAVIKALKERKLNSEIQSDWGEGCGDQGRLIHRRAVRVAIRK